MKKKRKRDMIYCENEEEKRLHALFYVCACVHEENGLSPCFCGNENGENDCKKNWENSSGFNFLK